MRIVSLVLLCLCLTYCAAAPPTVTTPQGAIAFQNLRIAKALDAVRDVAIAANAQQPPLLSTIATRRIVTWHDTAIKTLNARSTGWAGAISIGLSGAVANIAPPEREMLTPYVTLVTTIIQEVTKP